MQVGVGNFERRLSFGFGLGALVENKIGVSSVSSVERASESSYVIVSWPRCEVFVVVVARTSCESVLSFILYFSQKYIFSEF